MDSDPPSRNVAASRLTAGIAEKRIREFAATSDSIRWSDHALERMNEREIFDVDVLRALRLGMVRGAPEKTKMEEWKCKMVYKLRGSRSIGVVVIILKTDGLFVKTVEWEDLS
jgi:hypothetical protein